VLLAPDDIRAQETLNLALKYLGDPFDPRVVTWHIRRLEGHLGYGQGQLLMALLYTGNESEFRRRLQALFDVSTREIGDVYLMQEVLARPGNPNRGNKASLTYYPLMAAVLAGLPGQRGIMQKFIPDLVVRKGKREKKIVL